MHFRPSYTVDYKFWKESNIFLTNRSKESDLTGVAPCINIALKKEIRSL